MTRKLPLWLVGCFAAGAATVGVILVLARAPARVGGPGQAYLGMAWKSVRWPVPNDRGLDRFVAFQPGPALQGGGAFIGPYEVEVEDLHGVLYRDAGDTLKLAVRRDGTLHLLLVFGHAPDRPPLRAADGEMYDAVSGARESWGLTAKDGRRFDGGRDTPVGVRVTIGGRYYFQWWREDGRQKLKPERPPDPTEAP